MESQLFESLTFPVELYAQSFFRRMATDSRFLQVTHQKFSPTSNIDSKVIEFQLDRYDAGTLHKFYS